MDKKKILIVSNFYHPEITPRAFRVKELAEGLVDRGHEVDVLLPNKQIYKDTNSSKVNLIFANEKESLTNTIKIEPNLKDNSKKKVRSKFANVYHYLFPKEIFQTYNSGITKTISQTNQIYDVIISISHPLSIHFSTLYGIKRNPKLKDCKKIAEFSDPLFRGNYNDVFVIYRFLGYYFAKHFDHFVVPISESKQKFEVFKKGNVHIIPQGFNFNGIELKKYIANQPIKFAYAGKFYLHLRDPRFFLEKLKNIEEEFHFILYLSPNDIYFRNLIDNYSDLKNGKIEIRDFIPRKHLIYELSGMDFLINFENEDAAMSPSKLIDYALTNRPILSFNQQTFEMRKFIKFLHREYKDATQISTSDYDIKNIVQNFESLF